jgi:hypothetical protein
MEVRRIFLQSGSSQATEVAATIAKPAYAGKIQPATAGFATGSRGFTRQAC